MKTFLLLTFSIAAASCATQPNDLAGLANYAASGLQLPQYAASNLADPEFEAKVAFLFSILASTVEQNTHNLNGQTGNWVFVNDDGREAVFDANGNAVTDCENRGSFNYAHYRQAPLTHFSVDILPWLRQGNCREDTTTPSERIDAYLLDFQNGFDLAVANPRGYSLPVEFDMNGPGQSEAVAFFLTALEASDFDLLSFIMNGQYDGEERANFMEALRHGFNWHLENG